MDAIGIQNLKQSNPEKEIQVWDPYYEKDYFRKDLSEARIEGDTIVWYELEPIDMDSIKNYILAQKITEVARERVAKFNAIRWRYERVERAIRMGQTPDISIQNLDTYTQALADISEQEKYPFVVEWPVLQEGN